MESLVHILLGNALAATVLAMVAVAVGRIGRRPALTHSLWLIVLLKLVTPPLFPVAVPRAQAMLPVASYAATSPADRDHRVTDAATEPSTELRVNAGDLLVDSEPTSTALSYDVTDAKIDVTGVDAGPRLGNLPVQKESLSFSLPSGWKWEQTVLILVVSGAIGWWALAGMRIMRFQRLLLDVRPVPEDLQSHTDELAGRVGLFQRPTAYLVPGRVPPMLWAIGGRPRLLVPSELWAAMGEDERTSLLLHELAHLKRRDHWVRWLELIVTGLYWWHPVLWWARRALREAEEQCCDAWVVWAMPRRARTYAAALLAAVEFVSGARTAPAVASATSGSGQVSCLKRRLKMIVRAKTPKSLSWAGRIAVLGVAALLLPLAPSWARNDETQRSADTQPGQRADENLRSGKRDQLLALLAKDDDKDKGKDKDAQDDDKEAKARDAAEKFQEQLTDLIGKLGKQFSPVTEEIRKALDRAVGEVHKSLDKENLSVEDLGKALEKSQDELRKAFESGGPVDKELRDAIEHSRSDLQNALDRGKAEVQDQVEALRGKSRELADQARENLERAREAAEKGASPDGDHQPDRAELEAARKEIRDLEQQLRNSTRRFEELQRREVRRRAVPRREANPRAAARPGAAPAPAAEPVPPQAPREPVAPATPARPARPSMRRLPPPSRPGPGGARRGQVDTNEKRIQELEEKMKSLLKELETLKEEKTPTKE